MGKSSQKINNFEHQTILNKGNLILSSGFSKLRGIMLRLGINSEVEAQVLSLEKEVEELVDIIELHAKNSLELGSQGLDAEIQKVKFELEKKIDELKEAQKQAEKKVIFWQIISAFITVLAFLLKFIKISV